MKKTNPAEMFINRAELDENKPCRRNHCERCYEPLVFAMRGEKQEFSVGLLNRSGMSAVGITCADISTELTLPGWTVPLTDNEFKQIINEFRRLTQTPFLASQWLRGENGIAQIPIEREDFSKGNVTLTLFSNKDIAGGISSYEVVNQVVPVTEGRTTRGDVTLLINDLPIIHIELKGELAKDG